MKKQILNIGKALTRAEKKTINGGDLSCFHPLYGFHPLLRCSRNSDCTRLANTKGEPLFSGCDNGCCTAF